MTGFGFLILFGLSCLFPCEGAVSAPSNGTSFTFAPGSTGRIVWSFNDNIQPGSRRTWSFISRDGGQPLILAILDNDNENDDLTIQTSLYEIAIKKPATLVLKNVNETYNGTYQFSLAPSTGAGSSDVAVFIAATPLVQVDCRSPTIVNITDDFTCVCKGLGGNPAADVTWYKGNEQKSGPGKEQQDLNIPNGNKSDAGIYRCEAKSHEKAKNVTEIELIVNYPPENVKLTLTRNGGSATIECSADAQPPASFKIFLNKTKLVKSDKMHTISEINSSDVGNYTCFAENILGNKTSDPEYLFLAGPTTQTTPTTSISKTTTSQTITSPTTGKVPTTTPTPTTPPTTTPTPIGLIIGIIIPVLALIVIVGVVVYCCKSKQKERSNSRANIDPVPGNSHELGETGPSDGAYDTVWPVETSGSKSTAPVENALPPVYAAVDKNNREGNTLYASLDNEALKSSRASKKEPDRPPQTEYASIDFAKTGNAPKAV